MSYGKLIVEAAYGNHSNRLFQNLHFECFCKEYGIEYCRSVRYSGRIGVKR